MHATREYFEITDIQNHVICCFKSSITEGENINIIFASALKNLFDSSLLMRKVQFYEHELAIFIFSIKNG